MADSKMASPEDLIFKSPTFEDEIIDICGDRQKCPTYALFGGYQLGKYFNVGPFLDKSKLVPIDKVSAKPIGTIYIENASNYYIGFDLYKDGALLFSHSSSSSGEYLAPGDHIEYDDTSTATYAIDLAMHYSEGDGRIEQLCPTCKKQILINGVVPDTDDTYIVSIEFWHTKSIRLEVQDEGADPPPPGKKN